jgi:hypothetical protein
MLAAALIIMAAAFWRILNTPGPTPVTTFSEATPATA